MGALQVTDLVDVPHIFPKDDNRHAIMREEGQTRGENREMEFRVTRKLLPEEQIDPSEGILLDEVNEIVKLRIGQTDDCVCSAVINRHTPGRWINQGRAGEDNIRNITDALVILPRIKQIRTRSVNHLPRFLKIQQCRTEAIHKPVARSQHTMVNQQPAFRRFYRCRPCTHFSGLPTIGWRHDMSVMAPVNQIGAFAVEDVAKRCMACLTRFTPPVWSSATHPASTSCRPETPSASPREEGSLGL